MASARTKPVSRPQEKNPETEAVSREKSADDPDALNDGGVQDFGHFVDQNLESSSTDHCGNRACVNSGTDTMALPLLTQAPLPQTPAILSPEIQLQDIAKTPAGVMVGIQIESPYAYEPSFPDALPQNYSVGAQPADIISAALNHLNGTASFTAIDKPNPQAGAPFPVAALDAVSHASISLDESAITGLSTSPAVTGNVSQSPPLAQDTVNQLLNIVPGGPAVSPAPVTTDDPGKDNLQAVFLPPAALSSAANIQPNIIPEPESSPGKPVSSPDKPVLAPSDRPDGSQLTIPQTSSSNVDGPTPLSLAGPLLQKGQNADTGVPASQEAPANPSSVMQAAPMMVQALMPNIGKPAAEVIDQTNAGWAQPVDRFSARRLSASLTNPDAVTAQQPAPAAPGQNVSALQQTQPNAQSFAETLTQNTAGMNMAAPEGTTQDAVPDTTQLQTQSGNVIYLDKGDASRQSINAAPAPVQTHPHPVSPPIRDIALHISQHADNGISRFQLRLDPPELGRVEVRMEISADGKMSAVIAVERPETLDLLQRDSRALERSLMEAGLKTDGNSLSFSLKGGRHESQPQESANSGNTAALLSTNEWDETSLPMNARFANRTVNIRI